MSQIFISYSRADRDFVDDLIRQVEEQGFDVWVDREDIGGGKDWRAAISQAISECRFFLLVLSPSSVDSRKVTQELSLADEHGRKIIPIRFQRCEIPHQMSLQLATLQWIDFVENPQDGMQQLLRALQEETAAKQARPASPGAQHGHPASHVDVLRLEGTYRRRYDDAASGMGKTDSITFGGDGRFQEQGFLAAALGSQILPNGSVVFFDSKAGGEGTFRLPPETLELTYTSNSYRGEHQVGGGPISLSFHPLDLMADTNVVTAAILNTRYTFVRVSTGRASRPAAPDARPIARLDDAHPAGKSTAPSNQPAPATTPTPSPPALARTLPGTWHVQIVHRPGAVANLTVELNPAGVFCGRLMTPAGMTAVQGKWQMASLNLVVMQGQETDGFVFRPFTVMVEFQQVMPNQLTGTTASGQQVIWQRLR